MKPQEFVVEIKERKDEAVYYFIVESKLGREPHQTYDTALREWVKQCGDPGKKFQVAIFLTPPMEMVEETHTRIQVVEDSGLKGFNAD